MSSSDRKVVGITGAAGYLGVRLIAHLLKQPWVGQLVAMDLKSVTPDSRIISHQVDITETDTLRAILVEHGVTHLIHAAFQITPDGDVDRMQTSNVDGSRSVFQASFNFVEHLTFVSSVAVYGYHPGQSYRLRETAQLRPTMLYGQHKLKAEAALRRFTVYPSMTGPRTRTAIIRLAAVAGPTGATRSHLRALASQPFFVVANGGRALTQAIHEDDAADLIGAAVREDADGVFNGAPDDQASWAEIGQLTSKRVISMPAFMLRQATRLNTTLPALYGFTQDVVDLFSQTLIVDNAATRSRLNWAPRYSTCDAFYQMFKAQGAAR